jgi:glycosyltransferase involved in cell wall biosynthesis
MKIAISVNLPLEKRTGVEEYIYRLLQNIPKVDGFKNHQFFILAPKVIEGLTEKIPIKILNWPFRKFWTIFRLSWEMYKNKYDVLFVPAHLYPFMPKKTKLIITVQGLEFEKLSKMYPFLKRKLLRWITKRNSRRANQIIVPSKSTKNDLIKYYRIEPNKINVIYHGVNEPTLNNQNIKYKIQETRNKIQNTKYILYLGRGDKRKNIKGLIRAFNILKKNHPPRVGSRVEAGQIPHKLILTGPNIGYKIIKKLSNEIICTGYVDENKKWELLKNADVFVFPSLYEGFGIPILEAQKVGTPVVCSSISSMPEIIYNPNNNQPSAILVNPYKPTDIAEGIHQIIRNPQFANELIKRGYENVQRFSWHKCATETLKIILE